MRCPYCGKEALFTENKAIYGKNYGKSYMCYLCASCDAYVGVHDNDPTRPLGTMANKALREARRDAHALFDRAWKGGRKTRQEAYRELSRHFRKEMHIAQADIATCRRICGYSLMRDLL